MAKTTDTRRRDSIPVEVPYHSKVSLPPRRPAIVRRQRLIDLLAAGSERRVTLMSAPAGYGKTTLLLDFAQSAPVPVCWYSLDERDRDLDTFLRYFAACGQAQFPRFAGGLATALRADALPPPPAPRLPRGPVRPHLAPAVRAAADVRTPGSGSDKQPRVRVQLRGGRAAVSGRPPQRS